MILLNNVCFTAVSKVIFLRLCRDLKVPGLSSEGLLLKYTRRSQPKPDVEPIFSAR